MVENLSHNKRMQSDLLKRYALASAADARRYSAMIREVLDNRQFKIAFGIIVGIPGTIVFIVAFSYGVVFGIAAYKDFNIPSAAFAISAFLGAIGMFGAWYRLARQWQNFSHSELTFVRISLACGIVASVILFSIAIWAESYLTFGVPLFLLTLAGIVFYVGT